MAEQDTQEQQDEGQSIDYTKSQDAINKAKAKAADADRKRLAEEHEAHA